MMQKYENIILKAYVQLKRNFDDYFFTNKISLEEAEEVARGIYRIFENDFDFKKLKNIKDHERLLMLENDEISPDLLDNLDISYLATKNDLSLYINGEEHLCINCKSDDIISCYNKVREIDEYISSLIPIAYNKKIGYLTSNLKYFGDGMFLKAILFLPALSKSNKIEKICTQLNAGNIMLSAKYDNNIPIYELYNVSCNSISEEDLINSFVNIINKIENQETEEQNILRKISKNDLIDKAYRALGLLRYCYSISKKEAMINVCDIKLGILLGIFNDNNAHIEEKNGKNIIVSSQKLLDKLKYLVNNFDLLDTLTKIQDENLQELFSDTLNKKQIDIKRAEYLNNFFNK